jgi:hypothetical protein
VASDYEDREVLEVEPGVFVSLLGEDEEPDLELFSEAADRGRGAGGLLGDQQEGAELGGVRGGLAGVSRLGQQAQVLLVEGQD